MWWRVGGLCIVWSMEGNKPYRAWESSLKFGPSMGCPGFLRWMVHPVQLGEAALLARVTGEGEDSPRKLPAHGTEHVSKLRSPIDPRVLFLLLSCSSHEDLRTDRVWAFFSSGFPGGLKKCLGACVVHKLQIWDNLEVKLSSGTDAGRVIPNLGRSHHLHSRMIYPLVTWSKVSVRCSRVTWPCWWSRKGRTQRKGGKTQRKGGREEAGREGERKQGRGREGVSCAHVQLGPVLCSPLLVGFESCDVCASYVCACDGCVVFSFPTLSPSVSLSLVTCKSGSKLKQNDQYHTFKFMLIEWLFGDILTHFTSEMVSFRALTLWFHWNTAGRW